MKKRNFLRTLASLLAVAMLVTISNVVLPLTASADSEAQSQQGEAFTWGFESGELAPFKLVSGSYGTIISNIPWMHNSATEAFPRVGDYHLSTLESTTYFTAEDATREWADPTKMTKPSDAYICEIHSPMFRLDDAKMDFLVGGGNSGVYVALCDVYGQEIIRATGNHSEEMIRVEWDLEYDENLIGEYVFIKIVDASTDSWGHITFDDFHATGYINEAMSIQPMPSAMIHWSFESGGLSSFKVTEGEFGTGLIANWITERNAPYGKINKDGNYYLSTVETDTTAAIDESYVGTIVSPTFSIKDPKVKLKVGGGALEENYVAIVKASDSTELVKFSLSALPTYRYDSNGDGSKDATATSPYVFTNVTLTIPEALYSRGMDVYIKIVDGSTGENGFISVDDICAVGRVRENTFTYESIVWDFEDGTQEPFEVNGTFGKGLVATYVHNGVSVPSGNYYINTLLNNPNAYNWNEGYTGELVSPAFMLDPANPKITLSVNGGLANAGNYVGVFNKTTEEELARVSRTQNGWNFTSETIDLSGKFNEGDLLVLKIVDSTTAGWAWLGADNIRFSGALVKSEYAETVWSFENGTYQPFTTEDTFGKGLVATYIHGGASIPHGSSYINTVLTSPNSYAFNESYVGALVSPKFMLDPANPIIKVAVNGGAASSGNFVGVYNAETGAELAKVGGNRSWNFVDATLDLTGKFKEGDLLVIKIVDGTTSGWGWLGVDYIRGSFAFLPEEVPTTENSIAGASVNVGSDLSLLAHVILEEGKSIDDYSMQFVHENGAEIIVENAKLKDDKYVFVLDEIAPQAMGDLITIHLLKDGEIVDTQADYSVKAYAQEILNGDYDTKIKTFVSDMLVYGAAAQNFVGYNTDDLVTDGITGLVASTAIPDASVNVNTGKQNGEAVEGLGFAAVGVKFDSANYIYAKFQASSLDGITVTVNGTSAEIVDLGNGVYAVYSEAIYATDFDTTYTIVLNNNGIAYQTLTYSVNSYAYAKANTELGLALYRYGASADALLA